MSSFAVVTDSAADIPRELAERLGIHVVPLHVVAAGRDYADGVDIDTAALLRIIREGGDLPVTSQPTPADFMDAYRRVIDEGHPSILSIHLSRSLSATIESARAIASRLPEGIRLEVVDGCTATVAQGLMVLEAAAIAADGGTIEEAMERVEAIKRTARIHFIPATLENLVKGGRATRAQGVAASLLDIKLVIGLEPDGSIEVERKAKGIRAAVRFLAKSLAAQAEEQGPLMGYRLHTRAPEALAAMTEAVEKAGAPVRWLTDATIGPVIATHVGEGAVGSLTYPASLHHPALDDVERYLTPNL